MTGENRRQWNRFKSLPNLMYTDGSEWSLYRTGELRARTRIATDITSGQTTLNEDSTLKFAELLRDFLYWEPIVPSSGERLAHFLAPLTRVLRDEVKYALGLQHSPLRKLSDEWSGILFPETDDAQFADAYAQTVTYALLLARFEGAENLRPGFAVDALQREHGLLAEALLLLEAPAVRKSLNMPIELLERAIANVDAMQLTDSADPWLYFYEQFLGAYDSKLRKERGVYYTPVPVVQAQVRLAADLLRTRFNKRLAFADDGVVVLDPATGTGTYPLAVLDHARTSVEQRYGPGAVSDRIRGVANRLYAFEILVGPYSVAHLRLSQRMKEAGVVDLPAKVFLTDTLESPNHPPAFTASLLQARLTDERRRAQAVKKDVSVLVCLGNPPYHRDLRDPREGNVSRRKGGWVRYGDDTQPGLVPETPIFDDFLAPVRNSKQGVHLKPIYNDYVYFWRWALWKVLDSTRSPGIITFITASSFLRGPGFAGMRQKMREAFDEIWIIDLGGERSGTRQTENVFAIQIPVCITIGVRSGAPKLEEPASVSHTRIYGTESEKLQALAAADVLSDFDWRNCADGWGEPFQPKVPGAFFQLPTLGEIFPNRLTGAALYRTWPIGETRELLKARWETLLRAKGEKRAQVFKETRDRKIDRRYRHLVNRSYRQETLASLEPGSDPPEIQRYGFRSFDRQFVLADSRLGDFLRPDLWEAHSDEQMYLVTLYTHPIGTGPGATVSSEIPDQHYFRGSFGDRGIFPLWSDAERRTPNIAPGLLDQLSNTYGDTVSASDLFAYAYGVLAQPKYVDTHWNELETSPPRLPITKDPSLFWRIRELGARLVNLHTFGQRFRPIGTELWVRQGVARCISAVSTTDYSDKCSYDAECGEIRIGSGRFGPVRPEIWAYSVSGMPIVKSWIARRSRNGAGKKSSPLDDIRPSKWTFTEELLELLWILEATIGLGDAGSDLIDAICAGPVFLREELNSRSVV